MAEARKTWLEGLEKEFAAKERIQIDPDTNSTEDIYIYRELYEPSLQIL
jgi:hypothetical protein